MADLRKIDRICPDQTGNKRDRPASNRERPVQKPPNIRLLLYGPGWMETVAESVRIECGIADKGRDACRCSTSADHGSEG